MDILNELNKYKVNIGGNYKNVYSCRVNIGGTWKKVTGIYSNIGGVWKETLQTPFDKFSTVETSSTSYLDNPGFYQINFPAQNDFVSYDCGLHTYTATTVDVQLLVNGVWASTVYSKATTQGTWGGATGEQVVLYSSERLWLPTDNVTGIRLIPRSGSWKLGWNGDRAGKLLKL